MSLIDVNLLGKDIRRFADGTYHIVSLHRLFAGQVLYLVIGLVEGRTDEVGETSIDNTELLDVAFFYI